MDREWKRVVHWMFSITRQTSLVCCWHSSCFISVKNRDLYVRNSILHADRTTFMCIWTTTEPRVRLLERKTGLSPPPPPPSNLLLTVPRRCSVVVHSNCQCSSAFCFVFDLLFNLFRITLWPSVGKELSPWHFTCAVFYFSVVWIVGVPFPFGVWDVEFDCIGSWSLPFYLLCPSCPSAWNIHQIRKTQE